MGEVWFGAAPGPVGLIEVTELAGLRGPPQGSTKDLTLQQGFVGFTVGVAEGPLHVEHPRGGDVPGHGFLEENAHRGKALVLQESGDQTHGPLTGASPGG